MEITNANTSAAVIANQMPSSLNRIGSISTAATWNTSVRRKDMAAETAPLLSAVKNDDANMFTPANINENENILNA